MEWSSDICVAMNRLNGHGWIPYQLCGADEVEASAPSRFRKCCLFGPLASTIGIINEDIPSTESSHRLPALKMISSFSR
jgi:hypothetical protein